MARSAAATFVAFESFTKRTPWSSRTSSMRCGTPGKLTSAAAIASSGIPAARAAAVAAAAFSRLCSPGSAGSAGSGSSAPNSTRLAAPGTGPKPRGTIGDVVLGLRLEDAELRVDVPLEGPVAVEMVGLEVEQHGDPRPQELDVLELERGELADDPCVVFDLSCERRQRPADVPGDLDRPAGGAKHRTQELARRRLSVRTRHAEDRVSEQPCAELDLAPDGNAEGSSPRDQRRLPRNARALHDEIEPL